MGKPSKFFMLVFVLNVGVKADNIALHKPAAQSGVWNNSVANRAVDGNTNQHLEAGSCAHPFMRPGSWWTVDLSDNDPNMAFVIVNVTIYFRDILEDRNPGNRILVGNDPDWTKQTECARVTSNITIQTLPCTPPVPVRYLTLRHDTVWEQTYCEVIVNGYRYKDCPDGMWGEGCQLPCPSSCEYSCHDIKGDCTGCTAGNYGNRCTHRCNCNDTKEVCNRLDGACRSGCPFGFMGLNCSLLTNSESAAQSQSSVIGGSTAAVVLVVIIIIIICFLFKRYQCIKRDRSERKDQGTVNPTYAENNDAAPSTDDQPYEELHEEERTVTQQKKVAGQNRQDRGQQHVSSYKSRQGISPAAVATSQPHYESLQDHSYQPIIGLLPDIRVIDLKRYIESMRKKPHAFNEEFKTLPSGPTAAWDVGNKPENREKHCSLKVKAYDHSRVVLGADYRDYVSIKRSTMIHESDYINASFISGYGGVEKAYIAAQAPMENTLIDMWQMVWETKSSRIVMFVLDDDAEEHGSYWVENGIVSYGDFKVAHVGSDKFDTFIMRTFCVVFQGESRMIQQFNFTYWSHRAKLPLSSAMLDFRMRINSYDSDATGPLIIHCCTGVGMTGTYIAVDRCLQQAEEEGVVNVWGTVYQMRTERVNMVDTLEQYKFIYKVVLCHVEATI